MTRPVHAPELDSPLGWLNTDRPLRFDDALRGRVVVLDFWTYCCINCIHILPDLAWLERKYAAQPVVFIGVHSAKFTNEADRETIRAAVNRYEISHPVVIDDRMKLWRAYAVRSWPTVVVVDASGRLAAVLAGEGQREALDRAIHEALGQGRAAATLAQSPVDLTPEIFETYESPLRFPGKVFADPQLQQLFIADSNHNRIVIADWPDAGGHCKLLRVVGSGAVGAGDGAAERATFNHPQGLVTGQGGVYVADTENHLIRRIDLADHHVATVVGNGRMTYDFAGGAMGVDQGLNSPWDLAREGSTLYVAMAGEHQIWRIDMPVGFARALAGTGRENLADGPTEGAAFAQPSGICLHNGHLFIADSEVSAIRGIDMATERVYTVLGEGLFTFGDADGAHPVARLQHPLGVASWSGGLLVADTYNHKIKIVDPAARSARTILGNGRPGRLSDAGGPLFFEPGGLSCAGDDLFIADTNNHRIVHVNLVSRQWKELAVEGLTAPCVPAGENGGARRSPTAPDIAGAPRMPLSVPTSGTLELLIDPDFPPPLHLSTEAPWSVEVSTPDGVLARATGSGTPLRVILALPGAATSGAAWIVRADGMCCRDGASGACMPYGAVLHLTIEPADSAPRAVTLRPQVCETEIGAA